MAADLQIHIRTKDIPERAFELFFSNCLGSKYCTPPNFGYNCNTLNQLEKEFEKQYGKTPHDMIANTPSVWIGEVSWLKAAIFEDNETFVPNMVGEISEIIGDNFPTINDDLINKIKQACRLENKTQYDLAKENDILKFLENHKGEQVFTVNW